MKKSGLSTIFNRFSDAHRETIKTIYRAEVKAPDMGESVSVILAKYRDVYKRLKSNKKVISNLNYIIRELDRRSDRDVVYKGILSDDIVLFLKEASKKHIKPSMIFEKYAPIKEKADKISRSTRNKLFIPIIVYFVALFGVNFMLSIFKEMRDDAIMPFSATVNFILDNFLWINGLIGIILIVLVFLYTEKLPIIKNAFLEIRGMLTLASIEVYHEMRYSSAEMIPALKRQFSLKYSPTKKDIEGLVRLLEKEKLINPFQAAEIEIETERGKLLRGIQVALDEKTEKVEKLNYIMQDTIGKFSILMVAPQIIQAIIVVAGMMLATADFKASF
ncbi:MAG: Unknown protein [uncultured Sulfurovum sp.]|uniref:Type II secretion system protein GspF domain-containing protein n=1 Tax=uncultured Sulfurovum sp. TaxID=269237 RepID=A0A6S6SMQ5_9BACT|nr:MAG: Unknown protein [uncultured Sulfurovum sp.]